MSFSCLSSYAPAEIPNSIPCPPYCCRPWNQQVPDASLYSRIHKSYVHIRRVSKHNFHQEMEIIGYLINYTAFCIVSIDTEYPGVLLSSNKHEDRNPEAEYRMMKVNVSCTKLIQVGLTLSDYTGRLPVLGGDNRMVVWEIAISDFDIRTYYSNKASIDMLRSRGLDFDFHRREGIDSKTLAQKMLDIGLLENPSDNVTWVTFQGAYDFAYLIKAAEKRLPETLEDFQLLVRYCFGTDVYDVKYMLKQYPFLFGGLEAIAAKIGVQRVPALGHQAGADSLLTQMVFEKLQKEYFMDKEMLKKAAGHIHPLAN
ncbi:hypothetical protein QQ045_012090 [Rhodiola kirilowii]